MPLYIPGSTTATAASVANQTLILSAAAAGARRLMVLNASGGLVYVRITNSDDLAAATSADVPVPVTNTLPLVLDKKPGDNRVSLLGTVATGTVYFTGVDGY